MSESFNPSHCTIESAMIKSADNRDASITALIYGFNLKQSIYSSSFSGTLKVLDLVGTLHDFPLRAEEELELIIKGHDLQTELNIKGQIVKIDGLFKNDLGDGYFYTLHFVSRTTFRAGIQSVITAFTNKSGSHAAKQLFKKYFNQGKELTLATSVGEMPDNSESLQLSSNKGRAFYIEESDGQMRTIIPDYTPVQAMNFLASKSKAGTQSPSNMFRFFETFGGYYWVTDEWLLKRAMKNANKIKDFYYLSFSEQDASQYADIMVRNVVSFENSNHVDTGADIDSGAYKNTVMEIDFVNHTRTSYNFDYQKAKKKYIGMSGQPRTSNVGAVHSDKFITETFKDTNKNAKQFVVYRDWQPDGVTSIPGQVLRTPQNMVEIIQNRVAYNYHLNNSTVSLGIEGRIDLVPGDVINLITQEPNIALENKQNERLSGKYLIAAVDHSMDQNTLKTQVEAIKYGWQKGDI
jgi:hypothetical protein